MLVPVMPMASLAALAARQNHTLALCADEIIETNEDAPENIHGLQGDYFSPINSFSNLRRIAPRTKNPSQNQDAVGLALQGNGTESVLIFRRCEHISVFLLEYTPDSAHATSGLSWGARRMTFIG